MELLPAPEEFADAAPWRADGGLPVEMYDALEQHGADLRDSATSR